MLEQFRKSEPYDTFLGLLMLFSLAITLPALALDDRLFQGSNVWIKTIKFQVSLTLYFLTLAFFARWLPAGTLQNKWYRIFSILVGFTVICEIVWIGFGSANAIASHYNREQPIMQVIYPIMGLFAIILTSKSLLAGWLIWRNPNTGLPPAVHTSIALGLALTCAFTLSAAIPLAGQEEHFVGVPETNETIPFMGWSLEVGDPRIAHFLGTHAMHAIPLLGLLALLFSNLQHRKFIVYAGTIGYSAIFLFVLVQALAGLPITSFAFQT